MLSDPIKRANYDKLFHGQYCSYFLFVADEDVVAQEVFPFSEFEFCMSDECYYHNCRCGGKFEVSVPDLIYLVDF